MKMGRNTEVRIIFFIRVSNFFRVDAGMVMSCPVPKTIENKESIANELQTVIHILLETKKVIIFVVDANNKANVFSNNRILARWTSVCIRMDNLDAQLTL